jgi:hypothetical protein
MSIRLVFAPKHTLFNIVPKSRHAVTSPKDRNAFTSDKPDDYDIPVKKWTRNLI